MHNDINKCILYLTSKGGSNVNIYTVEEVADLLTLKPETVRVMLRDNEINGFKAGKAWRVTEDDLKKYIQEQGGAIA